MRTAYFDSSILLSMMLLEERAGMALDLWERHTRRVSSILLDAECWTVLRRHFLRNRIRATTAWMQERTDFLAEALATVQILHVDHRVMDVLHGEVGLAECRTLDALHLATALFLSARADEGLAVISLDEKMRQIARKLGLEVLPA